MSQFSFAPVQVQIASTDCFGAELIVLSERPRSATMPSDESIRPSRHSHALVKQSGEFGLNVPSADLLRALDYCGNVSGRDVDKFNAMGLTPVPAHIIRTPLIAECLGGTVPLAFCPTLEEAVSRGYELSQPGDVVLLSPACASYDMFDNFEHRGDVFRNAVEALRASVNRSGEALA